MRIGVLGGSFDPIHNGHLYLANQARQRMNLEHVLFVVAPVPPHKRPDDLISSYHRYAMVANALQGYPRFLASTIELENPSEPFTIVTLPEVCRRYQVRPDDVFFIAGGDSLKFFSSWRDWRRLLAGSFHFVFIARQGTQVNLQELDLPTDIQSRFRNEIGDAGEPGVHYWLQLDAPDVSSSSIREQVRRGEDIAALVPPEVLQYIQKYDLYRVREGN